MEVELLLALLFGGLLLGLFLGFPVGFVMLGSGLIVGVLGSGASFTHTLIFRCYSVMTNYELVAIPLFVYMGMMLTVSGTAEKLFFSLSYCFGRIKGRIGNNNGDYLHHNGCRNRDCGCLSRFHGTFRPARHAKKEL